MSDQNIIRLMDLGIKRLNSKEDFDAFQAFVTEELDLNTICSMIDKKIDEEDGPKLLEYILVAFSVKPDSQKIVEQLYDYVMNAINTTEIPEKMKVCLISRLSLNLYKLSSEQLIKFINMCKKDIEDANENCMQSWKELIPQILKMISEIKVLTVGGLEMTGAEYKEMIIIDICRNKIQTNVTVPVAFMLRRTQLTEKEHDLVIKSLCSYLDEMKPQEIPPLLQQIINFCKNEDYLDVFCTLQKYFDDKYIENHNNEENNAFPIEDAEQKELLEAQSTVLFLLEDFSKYHSSFVVAITKYIQNCICAPNVVFGPFMLAFLLTLSCCTPYKTNVISLVKKLITQSLLEVENTKCSFWLKINCTNIYDVYSEFKIFIKSDITSYEKVFKGLVDLGVSLLGTASIRKKNIDITNKIHQLGMFVIVTLVDKRPFITGSVLRTLTDFITSNPKSSQYIECLHLLCKNQKTDVIEKNSELLRLFREIPVGLTNKITCAVIPVLKISTCLRDNVIMVLRKELMSKDFQLRHGAVLGFVEILCSIRLEDSFTSLSQSTNSQDSWSGLFTQMVLNRTTIDIHGTVDSENTLNNKSLCLEIINILKICFFQKSEIKKTLYRGLIRVMSHNSGLCVYINNLISNHMRSWCIRVTDDKKSLKFDKSIIEDKHNNLISHEPLEELILLVQHIITKNRSYSNNEECTDKLKILLGKLVNFYSDCNMDEIKVNENDSLLDVMSDISQYSDIIKQVLCVYQVFMVYIVNTWTSSDQDKECSEKLQHLFSKYNFIVEAIEASNKTNKKKDKKQKSEITFKFIEPVMNLEFDDLYKFLSLLITNVNWASDVTVEPLKRNTRLWEFVLKLVQTHLNEIESLILQDIKSPNMYGNLCKLTKLLYNHFLFDISENLQFSTVVVELGIECYLQIIKFVSSHYKKLDKFLSDSNGQTSTNSSKEIFNVLRNIRLHLDKILEMNQVDEIVDDIQDQAVYDKIECHLIGCVSVVCNAISQNHDAKVENILTWLSTVVEKYSFSNSNNSKDFLTLLLDMHMANQEDPIMLATLVKNLCFLFGHINSSRKADQLQQKSFKFITELNKTMVFPVLCQYLCNELNYALLCLTRIKAELNASQRKNTCQDRLKSREHAICHRIILVILAMISLTKTVIPLGQCTESVFNLLFHIYHTVNIITKHFLVRSSLQKPVYKQALLGKLSEIINNQLSPNVSKFIMFVEHDRPLTDKEKKSIQLKTQTRRQTNYIPKVVTELELFVTLITKLGKKCKDQNLINSVKLTSSRDFRLNVQKLQDLLSEQHNSDDSDSEVEEISAGDQSNASKTIDEPPKKKRRFNSSASSSSSDKSTSPVL